MQEPSVNIEELLKKPSSNKRWVYGALILIIIIAAGYYYYSQQSSDETTTTIEEVITEHIVSTGTISKTFNTSVTTTARQSVGMKFSSSGTVNKILVNVGDSVKKGDPLIALDDHDALHTVKQREISLKQAKLQKENLLQLPTEVEIATVNQSVTSALNQVATARTKLQDYFEDPGTLSKIENSTPLATITNSIAQSRKNVLSAERQVTNTLANLRSSRQNYCSLIQSFNIFSKKPFNVCSEKDIPLSEKSLNSLIQQINETHVYEDNLYGATSSLIASDSNYKSSLDTLAFNKITLSVEEDQLPNDLIQKRNSLKNAEAILAKALASQKELHEGAKAIDVQLKDVAIETSTLSLDEAKYALENLTLVAPFDGIIATVDVSIFQKITANSQVLSLVNVNSIGLDLTVSEMDRPEINTGQLGIAKFDAIPDEQYLFQISGVSPKPETNQGIVSYHVEANLLNRSDLRALEQDDLIPLIRLVNADSLSNTTESQQRPDRSTTREMIMQLRDCAEEVLGRPLNNITQIRNLNENDRNLLLKHCEEFFPNIPGQNTNNRPEEIHDGIISSVPLYDGIGGTATVITQVKNDVILIPSTAITEQSGQTRVYVPSRLAITDGDRGKESIEIETGLSDLTNTEIIRGLSIDDVILIISSRVVSENEEDNSSQENSSALRGLR
tara:strand:- start:3207 stop:5228 length:2022 start_codon:yes stop_codon:yes gene_type:complete